MEQFSEILLKRIVVKNMDNTKMDLEGGYVVYLGQFIFFRIHTKEF